MLQKNKKLHNLGITLSCLGGLALIMNLSYWRDSGWGLEVSLLSVALALSGLFIISKAKSSEE